VETKDARCRNKSAGAQRLKDRRGESKASQDEDDSFIERAQGKKSIANWFRALSCYLISNRFSLVQSVENDVEGKSGRKVCREKGKGIR
jgi:hypothetical protein